jgi:hypothetical protein
MLINLRGVSTNKTIYYMFYRHANIQRTYSKRVDNLGQAVRTQLVDGLLADLLQDVRFLRVHIR